MAFRSVLDLLQQQVTHSSQRTAALVKRQGRYTPVTWQQLVDPAKRIASGLLQEGVALQDRVCVMGQSDLNWVLCDVAVLYMGAVTVPVYHSSLPDECRYIIDNSDAKIIFTQNAGYTQRILSVRQELPNLQRIVQMEGDIGSDGADLVVGLSTWLALEPLPDAICQQRAEAMTPSSLYTLIYTSGTTGRPKGVMISHDNMLYEAEAVAEIDLIQPSDIQLFFLPLAHVFARVLQVSWFSCGYVMAFAENMTTIKENLLEVRPTIMAGVPRIYEKFYSAVVNKGLAGSGLKLRLFREALKHCERKAKLQEQPGSFTTFEKIIGAVVKRLVFSKVHKGLSAALGGRMRMLISGAAPLSPKINWFFTEAGIDILEGYGLTESSAATIVNRIGRNKIGSVGLPLPATDVKLASDGELLLRGRGISMGYWKNPEATAQTFQDGWLCTGDIAMLDSNGFVSIVDRKKDIIITAGGKNISPQNIENQLKTHKLISQVVVHGDQRKFLSALITLDADALREQANQLGINQGSYADLTQRPEIYRLIEQAVEEINHHLAKYETIKRFKILAHDFSQESGEMTPSLKIKRKVINQRYQAVFDSFYESEAA